VIKPKIKEAVQEMDDAESNLEPFRYTASYSYFSEAKEKHLPIGI
jgi:hypothetical protein